MSLNNPIFNQPDEVTVWFAIRRVRDGPFVEETKLTKHELDLMTKTKTLISTMGFYRRIKAEMRDLTDGAVDPDTIPVSAGELKGAPPESLLLKPALELVFSNLTMSSFGFPDFGTATFDIQDLTEMDFVQRVRSCGGLPDMITVPKTSPSIPAGLPITVPPEPSADTAVSFVSTANSMKGTMYLVGDKDSQITLSLHLWKPKSLNSDNAASPRFQLICQLDTKDAETGRPKHVKQAFETFWRNASWLESSRSKDTKPTNTKHSINRKKALETLTSWYGAIPPTEESDVDVPSLETTHDMRESLRNLVYKGVSFQFKSRAALDEAWESWSQHNKHRKNAIRLIKSMDFAPE